MTVKHREDDQWDEEIRRLSEEQRQTGEEMGVLVETVREMVVAFTSLKERLVEETPPATSVPDRVAPLPVEQSSFPSPGVPVVQMRETLVVAPAPSVQSSGQGEVPGRGSLSVARLLEYRGLLFKPARNGM